MLELCLNFNPSYEDLTSIYDRATEYVGQKVKIIFKNGYYLVMVRKFTYSGSGVVKTNYLHGISYFPSGKEHATFKQTKEGFRYSSYYSKKE